MRKSIAAAGIAAFAARGCSQTAPRTAGRRSSRNYQVGDFDQIELAGPYDVDVKTGGNAGVLPAAAKRCSTSTVVEVQARQARDRARASAHGRLPLGLANNGKAQLAVTVPQLSGGDARRIGRHPASTGSPARISRATVAGSGGLTSARSRSRP